MKHWRYWLSLLILSLGCSRPFTMTASVNKTRWYGTGRAIIVNHQNTATCRVKRFSLWATTDVPYQSGITTKATGCRNDCIPTQHLDFYNVPLAKGTYDLTLPDTCLPVGLDKVHLFHFKTDPNGPHVMKGVSLQTTANFTQSTTQGWIRVTRYDSVSGLIKGRFELTLISKQGETLNLRKGKFSTNL